MPPPSPRLAHFRQQMLAATGAAEPLFRCDALLVLCDAADELAAEMRLKGDPGAAEVAATAGELRALAPLFAVP